MPQSLLAAVHGLPPHPVDRWAEMPLQSPATRCLPRCRLHGPCGWNDNQSQSLRKCELCLHWTYSLPVLFSEVHEVFSCV